MLVLGVETSCDETAAAVVEDGRRVRADVVASQILVHARYGGVVPEVASRQHVATIVPVIRRAVADAGVGLSDLDAIAVTCGPGLVGALLVGVETAKALSYALRKPLVGVNHLAGHLAAVFLEDPSLPAPPPYPHLALLVSGGHSAIIRVDGPGATRLLGSTRDDAAGEAFDKVGKMLGLGYPGGVAIDRLAAAGNPRAVAFPRALPGRDDIDFSFSGLKTAVATRLGGSAPPVGEALGDLCASFQAAVVDVLVRKSRRALVREGLQHLVVCGGVAANRGLRAALAAAAAEDGFDLFIPPPKRCTDNAAMIAAAGSQLYARGVRAPLDLAVDPGLPCDPREMIEDPRRVLARHGLRAKKSWGQNFLIDRSVHARIVAAAAAGPDDVVVEIGAGLGTLTSALLTADPAPRRVLAIERDPDMLRVLAAELGAEPRLAIIAEDAARFDFAAASAAAGRSLIVVGNLPYQIASVLTLAVAHGRGTIARAVVMVQREMAARIVAAPGGRTYGRLSVAVQQNADARVLFHVRPGSFHPAPQVTSSVVLLEPRVTPRAPARDPALFDEVVKQAFGTRRKMLRRALEPAYGEGRVAEALADAGIDGTLRAERLSVADFARLADGLGAALERARGAR